MSCAPIWQLQLFRLMVCYNRQETIYLGQCSKYLLRPIVSPGQLSAICKHDSSNRRTLTMLSVKGAETERKKNIPLAAALFDKHRSSYQSQFNWNINMVVFYDVYVSFASHSIVIEENSNIKRTNKLFIGVYDDISVWQWYSVKYSNHLTCLRNLMLHLCC